MSEATATCSNKVETTETRVRLVAPEYVCGNLNITTGDFHNRLVKYFNGPNFRDRMGPLTDSDLFRFVRFLNANVVLDGNRNPVGVAAVEYPAKRVGGDVVDGLAVPDPVTLEDDEEDAVRRPTRWIPDGHDWHFFEYYTKTLESMKEKIGITGKEGGRTAWIFILTTVTNNEDRRKCRWDLPLDIEMLGPEGTRWCTTRGLFQAEKSLKKEKDLWLLIGDFLKGREDILRPALNDYAYKYRLIIPCLFSRLTQPKEGVVRIEATKVFHSHEFRDVPNSVWLKSFCKHLVGFCVPKIYEVFGVVQRGRLLWVDEEKKGAIAPEGSLFDQVREACIKVERRVKKSRKSKNDTTTTGQQSPQEEFKYSTQQHGTKVLGINPHTQEPARIEVIGEFTNRPQQTFYVKFTDLVYCAELNASNFICSQDIALFPEFLKLLPPQGYPVITRVFTLQGSEEEWMTRSHKSFGPTGIPITFSVDAPARGNNAALIDVKVDIDNMEKSDIHKFFGNIFHGIAAPPPKPFNALEFYRQNSKMQDGEEGGKH